MGEGRGKLSGASGSTPSSPAASKEIVKYTAVTNALDSSFAAEDATLFLDPSQMEGTRVSCFAAFPSSVPGAADAIVPAYDFPYGDPKQLRVGYMHPQVYISYPPWQPTQFFTERTTIVVTLAEIEAITTSFNAMQYQCDHTQCFVRLVAKATQGKDIRMLLDESNFYSSSCARQSARVEELFNAGGQIRINRPKGAGFVINHVKTCIFDERVVLTGSVNMTNNGHENNKEHLFRIEEPGVVLDVLADFWREWEKAKVVTQVEIDKMISKEREAAERKREKSRSLSLAREASRALSTPLRAAAGSRT